MNSFQFDYNKFIVSNYPQRDLLNKMLFEKYTESKTGNHCNFCNGRITKLTIETKYLMLPKWLIVIVEKTQINNYEINQDLLKLKNGNVVVYQLYHFIE